MATDSGNDSRIVTVTQFKTRDGLNHHTAEEARRHADMLDLADQIKEALFSTTGRRTDCPIHFAGTHHMAEWLLDYFKVEPLPKLFANIEDGA